MDEIADRYEITDLIGFSWGSPCDHPSASRDGNGSCRCIVCGRCGRHTGNATQGHYWAFCKVTGTTRDHHFCCPDGCALPDPSAEGGNHG